MMSVMNANSSVVASNRSDVLLCYHTRKKFTIHAVEPSTSATTNSIVVGSIDGLNLLTKNLYDEENDNDNDNDMGDGDENMNRNEAPGPTSCLFLQRALKHLYAKDDFEILENLGEGFFGDVYKVRHRQTNEVMVLKVGKERKKESRLRAKMNILKEIAVLNQLSAHGNLLSFRGVCVEIEMDRERSTSLWNLHILVDYCDVGSLNRFICDKKRLFPWHLRLKFAKQIACGMSYVHSKNIMHRDLTSMNVLLQSMKCDGIKAVVADFGLSCTIPTNGECLTQVGTPYWMAPECLKEEFYDEKADIFSFGIIMCQMLARLDADPENGLYRTNNFGLDYDRFISHCQPGTPLELIKIAFECCLIDPSERPSFLSIYKQLRDLTQHQFSWPLSTQTMYHNRNQHHNLHDQLKQYLIKMNTPFEDDFQRASSLLVMDSEGTLNSKKSLSYTQLTSNTTDTERRRKTNSVIVFQPRSLKNRFNQSKSIVDLSHQRVSHEAGHNDGLIICSSLIQSKECIHDQNSLIESTITMSEHPLISSHYSNGNDDKNNDNDGHLMKDCSTYLCNNSKESCTLFSGTRINGNNNNVSSDNVNNNKHQSCILI